MQFNFVPRRLILLAATLAPAVLHAAETASADALLPEGWSFGALAEVEAFRASNDGFGDNEASDFTLATVELALVAPLSDWFTVNLFGLYEQNDTPLEIDEVTLTIAHTASYSLSLTLGQMYVPFGSFQTHLVSDPFTLELGEARETALLLGFENKGLQAAVWLFNGDLDDASGEERTKGGAWLGYVLGDEEQVWSAALSVTSDLADSDGIAGALEEAGIVRLRDEVAGLGLSVGFHNRFVSLIGEYVAALDRFEPSDLAHNGHGAEPSASNLELGYHFELGGYPFTSAVGYQRTREALVLGLPESRWAVGFSVVLMEQVGLGIEWAQDRDYGSTVGGSDAHNKILTAQLAVEF